MRGRNTIVEAFFNELCLNSIEQLNIKNISDIKKVYKALKGHGINSCRISHDDYLTLYQIALRTQASSRNLLHLILSFFKSPYESEDVEDNQNSFLDHDWTCEGKLCIGLSLAVIMDSVSVSIGEEEWNRSFIAILCDETEKDARNLFGEDTVAAHAEWLEGLLPVQLITCSLKPNEKQINLGDDHGKDVLTAFARRLVMSPYVYGIINSLPFHSGNRKFCHAVRPNGLVEIVLPWTDSGYGIVVRTTGRNLRETEKIAKILEKTYGSKQ